VVYDISERKAMDMALGAAKAEVERVSHSKSEFLAYLSHELRHPMNVITIATNLAMGGEPSTRPGEYMQAIQMATSSMLAIIDEILEFSKIEAGRQKLERIPLQMQVVLDIVWQMNAMVAKSKEVELLYISDPQIPAYLLGDPVRLGQVLMNLVSNGLKFTEQGKVTLEAQQIQLDAQTSRVRFSVTDSGIGMAQEEAAQLFEPFCQVNGSQRPQLGGAGLGLAISRRLVRLMGGDISVSSTPGKGSRFSFELSLPRMVDAEPQLGQDENSLAPHSWAGDRTLLLVEDSEINRILAANLLGVHGFHVETAQHGEEAVQKILDNRDAYGLVLMDLKMPVMDGYGAMQRIRQHYAADDLPIIAMTALALDSEREKCLAGGFNGFLTKPIDIKELLRVLRPA
jgi:CheY-like chemotaxis protein